MNKKLLFLLFAVAFISTGFGQDAKKFRFGLKAVPSLNWYRTDNTKMVKGGKFLGFGWGFVTEFKLTESASLSTGLQIDYDKGEVKFINDTSYFVRYNYTKDGNIAKGSVPYDSSMTAYQLGSRKYMINYITVPIIMKMHTKEIGALTYFGQFGFFLSAKTKARALDAVNELAPAPSSTQVTLGTKDAPLNIDKDSQLFRLQLSIGGGAEYNLAGNTSVVVGISYNRGFTNVLNPLFKSSSNYLLTKDNTAVTQKAFADNVALSVAIMF